MEEVNIEPLHLEEGNLVTPQSEQGPVEQVQDHRVGLHVKTTKDDNRTAEAHQPIHVNEQKRKKRGRPRTTGKGIRKTSEKHIMTQARLDALAKARKIRMEKAKVKKMLEKQEKENEENYKLIGKMVVNNAKMAGLESSNNTQVLAGESDSKLLNKINPILKSSHKNSHTPALTVGSEYNQANPFEPVNTVIFKDNGGVTQKVLKKDLTFML